MLQKGKILISSPFLNDPYFSKSVILLAEHSKEGSVGFILNKKLELSLQEVVSGVFFFDAPIYYGGPVEENALFYIHTYPQISGALEIMPHLYWGGNFEEIKSFINTSMPKASSIRFFAGYSGWGAGQLQSEMDSDTWLLHKISLQKIMNEENVSTLWQKQVRFSKEERFAYWVNMPQNPSLN
ncbi:MAG: YqgE/AlgH family protein [Raineya sp.]